MIRTLILSLAILSFTACEGQNGAAAGAGEGETSKVSDGTPQREIIFADLSVADFKAKMNDPNVVILDVRSDGEVAEGMIEGARQLDYRAADFQRQVSELDKDKTYLVYCASGGRSGRACEMMKELDFAEVYNLVGGYREYK